MAEVLLSTIVEDKSTWERLNLKMMQMAKLSQGSQATEEEFLSKRNISVTRKIVL